jgi:hypothetical protein
MNQSTRHLLSFVLVLMLSGSTIFAARVARGSAQTSVNRNANVNANRNTNVNANRNVNVNANSNVNVNANRNVNVNANRNVNVNVNRDIDVHGGYYGGGCCYHPIATAAAVTTAAVVTAAAVGSMVHSIPPSCTVVMVNELTYEQCGSTWYQPQFVGTSTNYVVVAAPR